MCVICICEMGKKFPTKKSIQNCADSNPDGFAMMWNEGGKVKNYKTLIKKEFMDFYDKFVKSHDHKTTAVVIHARIKTHGSLRIENCHCWTALDDSIGFAHNGILSIANRADLTDSETYFRDIFLPVYEWSDWKTAERTIDAIIGTSKFAFLTGDGVVHHYGHYIKHNNCLYSNSSYEEKVYYTSRNSSVGYTYSGRWSNGKWLADYYAKKDYMMMNGGMIGKGTISDTRWVLMCKYFFGVITEEEYCKGVVVTERAERSSTEWWLDEGEIDAGYGYKTYASSFSDKMEWELYVLYKLGALSATDYAKASCYGYGSSWEDDLKGYDF